MPGGMLADQPRGGVEVHHSRHHRGGAARLAGRLWRARAAACAEAFRPVAPVDRRRRHHRPEQQPPPAHGRPGLDITLLTNSFETERAGAEVLLTEPIVWAGAKGGCAHMREPLPVSLWEEGCAWRAGALEALGREGRNYRIAYMSAHTAGQRAAIMSDLAVAPLPKSFIGGDMVELCQGRHAGYRHLQSGDAGDGRCPAPVKAVADHIRATFEVFRETGKF